MSLFHQRSHSISPFRVAGFDGNDTGVGGGGSKSATKEENITDREDGEAQRQSSSRGWADWQPWWEESSLRETGFGPEQNTGVMGG